MAKKPTKSPKNNPLKLPALPVISAENSSMLESKDIVNQYLADYIDEMSLSNKNFVSKFWNIYKSTRQLNANIIAASNGVLDDDFTSLKALSKNFDGVVDTLSKKIVLLQKENKGLEHRDYSKTLLFGNIAKKYSEWNSGYTQLAEADRMHDKPAMATKIASKTSVPVTNDKSRRLSNNQLSFIDKLSAVITGVFVSKKDVVSEEDAKKKEEQDKKANNFYSKMLVWMGYQKAKDAIGATRQELNDKKGKFNNIANKTGKALTNSLDSILDLPMLITSGIAKFVGGFTSMLGTGLSVALVLGRKLLFSKLGVIASVGAYLFQSEIGEWIGKFMTSVFSEENLDKMKAVYNNIFSDDNIKKVMTTINGINWESTLLAATVGLRLAGPLGAIIGAVFGDSLSKALNIAVPEIEDRIKKIGERRDVIQANLKEQVDKVLDTQRQIEEAANAGDTLRNERLQKVLEVELANKRRIEIELGVKKLEKEKLERDKENIEKNPNYGKLLNGVDDTMRILADTIVKVGSIGTISGVDEIESRTSLWNKDVGEKNSKILDTIKGWFTLPEIGKFNYNNEDYGKLLANQPSALSPGAGVIAPNIEQSPRTIAMAKAVEMQKEIQRQKEALAISAYTVNNKSSVVQTTNSTAVQIRSSPIDPLFGNRAF